MGAARPAVVVAVVARRRVGQDVQLQRLADQRLEADLGEHRRPRGIGDPGFGEAPVGRLGDLAEGQRVRDRLHSRGDAGGGGLDVARVVVDRLAIDERLAVRHRELEAAERRRAQVGRVDLAQRGLAQREVRLAGQLMRRAEAVLISRRPGVDGAGCAGCRRLVRGRRGTGCCRRQRDDDRQRDEAPRGRTRRTSEHGPSRDSTRARTRHRCTRGVGGVRPKLGRLKRRVRRNGPRAPCGCAGVAALATVVSSRQL